MRMFYGDYRFELPVTATADNCLFTCYPFLSQHRTDHTFICTQVHSSHLLILTAVYMMLSLNR